MYYGCLPSSGSPQSGFDAAPSAAFALERDAACRPTQPDSVVLTGIQRVTGPGSLTLVRGDELAVYDQAWGTYALDLRNGRCVSGDRLVDIVAARKLVSSSTALFRHGRIKTTITKAKNLQPFVEKLITTARRGDLHLNSFPTRRSSDHRKSVV